MPATTSSNQTSQGGKPGNNHHNHKKGGRRTNNANTNAPKPFTPPVNGTITPVVIKEDEGDEEEVCWICAEPVTIYSVAQCNHRTCHVCALRLRALYKKMECTFCKEPQLSIIFSKSPSMLYEEYTPNDVPFSDNKLAISFETAEMMEETLVLLRFNCPDPECVFVGTGWADLKWHVKDAHGQVLCDLCIRSKKIFAHEHTLYPPSLLPIHLPSLRRAPQIPPQHRGRDPDKDGGGEVDFVHPMCTFCRECFYGDDELFAHLRERHEECFVCKRAGIRDVYFQNYEKLDEHFQNAHFPCTHPNCLEQKFVVFASALDLQAHQVETHGEAMSGRQKKERMRIEAGFSFEEVRTGGGRRGGANGQSGPSHDNNNGGGSRNGRRAAFGGNLTAPTDSEPSGSGNDSHQEYQTTDLAPLQQFLRNLSTSAQFSVISAVRGFKASECSARDMLVAIFNVFDRNLDVMGAVVPKILDILEDREEKKGECLQAWNGIKIEERQQFPSLTPVASSSTAGYSGITSGRVINIKKNATAPHKSTNRTDRRVWDRVAQAATSSAPPPPPVSRVRAPQPRPAVSSSSFPALGATSAAPFKPGRNTPWASSSSSANPSPTPTPQPPTPLLPYSVPASSETRDGPPPPSTSSKSLFPTLPSTSRTPMPREFLGGNQSLRNIRGTTGPGNVWAPAGKSGPSDEPFANPVRTTPQQQGKGKKKKGKETLFTMGAFPS